MFDWTCVSTTLEFRFQTRHKIPPVLDGETLRGIYDLLAHRIDGFAPNSHDLRDILRARNETECYITSDQIYGLLSLVTNGASFRVSYEEGAADLFWRIGNHFQAWPDVYRMEELHRTLRLTKDDIAKSMNKLDSVVLELRATTMAPEDLGSGGMCSNCGESWRVDTRGDITMCAGLTGKHSEYHVLFVKHRSIRKTADGIRRARLEHGFDIIVVHKSNISPLCCRQVSRRALKYRVGSEWRTCSPGKWALFEQTVADRRGTARGQIVAERWAIVLCPDELLESLDRVRDSGSSTL